MQTFVPFSDVRAIAVCLDRERLGKQRVECKQIFEILVGLASGNAWRNHPAVLMWEGHAHALLIYAMAMCEEWQLRGFKDNLWTEFYERRQRYFADAHCEFPSWWGNEAIHRNHRQRLIAKNRYHYEIVLKWTDGPTEHNLWPSQI